MKKLMILAAAVAAMAACTKSEVVYDDNDVEIALAPVTKLATKVVYGVYKNSWYTNTEKFNVFAQHTKDNPGTEWKSIELASSSTYLSDVTFVARDYEVWGGETPYYWPKTGSLFFAGYSPADVTISESGNKPSYTFANTPARGAQQRNAFDRRYPPPECGRRTPGGPPPGRCPARRSSG